MYKLMLDGKIIGVVDEKTKGAIIVKGNIFYTQSVDEEAKEIIVAPEEDTVYAKEYIPNTRFKVIGYEDNLPKYIEIDGQYIGEHRTIEINGKIYHAEGGGSRSGVPCIYLSELRSTKAIEVDGPHTNY